jgi:putative PIN family toxin of toxin-antitoxin system
MTVCLDTNVRVQIFGQRARYPSILQALLAGKVALALSNEILFEYEEVVTRMLGPTSWQKIGRTFSILEPLWGNILLVQPQFHFGVITEDPDDNKFCDCAISANADYVITEDRHLTSLAGAGYRPQPIRPEEFVSRFLQAVG